MKNILTLLFIIGLFACQQEIIQPPEDAEQLKSAKVDTLKNDRVIVKYKGQEKIQVLKGIKDIDKEIEKLSKDEKVEYAEPDNILTIDVFPNDFYFQNGSLWNMYSDNSTPTNQYGVHAIEQWEKGNTGDNNVYVAIIDQGYYYSHEDLYKNAGTNPFEIPNNGIDDEGNGYIDDVYGWDFSNKDNSVFDGIYDYHGTHVAGIIGAEGNNAIGVAGVVWNVKLFSAKFLGSMGGYTSDAVLAIDYLIDLKNRGLNLIACNCSWGGSTKSTALLEALQRAETAGIIMVCSAGNSGSNRPRYPAYYRANNIISEASINAVGELSTWSSFGNWVDIAAPGENIMSTYYSAEPYFLRYYTLSGTSMSAPHVTGAIALYKSLHPNATWQEIKDAILDNAVFTPSLKGKVNTKGRLDVSNF